MLKIYDVDWSATTAGPSPDNNKRTEIFLKGCSRGKIGVPCEGCFNKALWDDTANRVYTPEEVASKIEKFARNKYISISGGEPFDQYPDLLELCRLLKEKDFHILVYTSLSYQYIMVSGLSEIFKYIDILIDGEYKKDERIYLDNGDDGFRNSIGSGNQKIYSFTDLGVYAYAAKDLDMIALDDNGRLIYFIKERRVA